jgi:hypothetical protein
MKHVVLLRRGGIVADERGSLLASLRLATEGAQDDHLEGATLLGELPAGELASMLLDLGKGLPESAAALRRLGGLDEGELALERVGEVLVAARDPAARPGPGRRGGVGGSAGRGVVRGGLRLGLGLGLGLG